MAWERLAHVALSGAGDVLDSGTISAKKNLRVIVNIINDGNAGSEVTFNSDTAEGNYASRRSSDGASDSTYAGSAIPFDYGFYTGRGDTDQNRYIVMDITNISDKEKLVIGHLMVSGGAGSGNAPARTEFVAKWTNTSSQITSIQIKNNGTGSYDTGSSITVFAAKQAATANVITVSDLAAKKHLMIQAKIKGGNGNTFTFNNDTGNNYTHRYSNNGGSDGTQTSRANLWSYYDGSDTTKFTTLYVLNEASKEKLVITHNVSAVGTGAGTAPTRTETVGKWTNTSNQITRVDVGTFTTDGIEEGSEVTVYGTD